MDASDEDVVKACGHYEASLGKVVTVMHTAGESSVNTAAEDILCINAMGSIYSTYITEHFHNLLAESSVLIPLSSTDGYTFSAATPQID